MIRQKIEELEREYEELSDYRTQYSGEGTFIRGKICMLEELMTGVKVGA